MTENFNGSIPEKLASITPARYEYELDLKFIAIAFLGCTKRSPTQMAWEAKCSQQAIVSLETETIGL
ncbi:MAG: hypothetical protein SXA11_18650 [Cyanobacteriota bacterium]|nr:hypothetical protein [Cyanobacteriota bacterium]